MDKGAGGDGRAHPGVQGILANNSHRSEGNPHAGFSIDRIHDGEILVHKSLPTSISPASRAKNTVSPFPRRPIVSSGQCSVNFPSASASALRWMIS